MSHEEVHIVSKAHFDQVVLKSHNSSLKNDVGAIFVNDPSQDGFYQICASLGHLLGSFLDKRSWKIEQHSETLAEVCRTLKQVQQTHRFNAEQMAQLVSMAAANLDFCVDVVPAEDSTSEMVLSDGQRALMELQGKLRKPGDALREYLLASLAA